MNRLLIARASRFGKVGLSRLKCLHIGRRPVAIGQLSGDLVDFPFPIWLLCADRPIG